MQAKNYRGTTKRLVSEYRAEASTIKQNKLAQDRIASLEMRRQQITNTYYEKGGKYRYYGTKAGRNLPIPKKDIQYLGLIQ